MIIDSHTHIGFNKIISSKIFELISSMKKADIDKAMVYAGDLGNCSTEALLKEIKGYQNIIYPIGSISPLSKNKPSLKQVEDWLKNNQIYGLKFYPGYEPFYPFDDSLKPFLKLLIKYNRPVIFHSGDTFNLATGAKLKYAHSLHIDDLAVDMPDLKIIIAHMGYPWVIDTAEVCFKNKNVFTDCSGLVYDKFGNQDIELVKRILNDFKMFAGGLDKLIFGTDWPITDQEDYVTNMKQLIGLNEAIFSQNAKVIFGI